MNGKELSKKLSTARVSVLKEHPFFGRLLLRLSFGVASCGTAFTDMRRIVFDPQFADRLSDEELKYVLIHEVLHCALKHCTRGIGKQNFLYNVACDVVVNSMMLEMHYKNRIIIDGEEIMHLAPDGSEGREHSAEEVYAMLMKLSPEELESKYGGGGTDNHDAWGDQDRFTLEDLWTHRLKEAAAAGIGSGIPNLLARYLKEIDHTPRTNWRQILYDFIQFDKGDYDFARPDRRYSSDLILPSFCDHVDGGKVEKLWLFVDTSGSISDEALSASYGEICEAATQVRLSGMLSFFDYTVSEPILFEGLEDILSIKPIGGGGTSFRAVFETLGEYARENDLPNAIIIITDGFAPFPDEEAALGVPVIWIIVDSNVVPPWGAYAFIAA